MPRGRRVVALLVRVTGAAFAASRRLTLVR